MTHTNGEGTMEKGTLIAWVDRRHGITTGVSQLHRVYEDGRTYCLMPLPEPDRRFLPPLTGLKRCQHCDTLYAANATHREQVSYSMARASESDTPSRTAPRSVMPHA